MKLSIVIVNYNVKHFLEQCLRSVQNALKSIDGEVFIVDNNSTDGSAQLVAKKFPNVYLINNNENVGFARANNQAIKQAKGEYVLLLNPDTIVDEDTFEKTLWFMDSHPEAGALGVKMINGRGVFLPESKRGLPTPWVAFYKIFGLAKLFPKSKTFGKYHLSYLSPNKTHEVDVLSGAFMLLRKKTLVKTGLLDEDFFMYGEDIDLSYRIQQEGFKNFYFPETTIVHYKGESTKKGSLNYVRMFYKAMAVFQKKHFRGSQAKIFSFFVYLAIYFRALLAICKRIFQKIQLPFANVISMLQIKKKKHIAVIGQRNKNREIIEAVGKTQQNCQIIGHIAVYNKKDLTGYLGTLDQLEEIITANHIEELIFCTENMSTSVIINTMLSYNHLNINFKIIPQ